MQLTPQGADKRADDTDRIERNGMVRDPWKHASKEKESNNIFPPENFECENLNSIESKSLKRIEKRENKFCQGVKRNQNDNFSFPSSPHSQFIG